MILNSKIFLYILNNYEIIEKTTIVVIRYVYEILSPFLCSTYKKVSPFAKHPSNSNPQEWPLVIFNARSTYDQIVMEHVIFLVFLITLKFLIFIIVTFNKTYINQICNASNFSLTICAMGTCMVSNFAISCKVL